MKYWVVDIDFPDDPIEIYTDKDEAELRALELGSDYNYEIGPAVFIRVKEVPDE